MDKIGSDNLDSLSIDVLSLMNQLVQLSVNIGNSCTSGNIHVAKARYSEGFHRFDSISFVGDYQMQTMDSLVNVDVVPNLDHESFEALIKKGIPKQFGALPSPNIRSAQNDYQSAIKLVCEYATTRSIMLAKIEQYKRLRNNKVNLKLII